MDQLPQLPRWWQRRGEPDQFDDYSREELVAVDPHDLMENELAAYLGAVSRAFGEAAFELMTGPGLPGPAEEWLEIEYPDGDRMYTFLQNLHDNPFGLESETDSEDSGDSGNNSESGSDNGNGSGNDDGPKNPPPPPPNAEIEA